jgi:hypothetical protein
VSHSGAAREKVKKYGDFARPHAGGATLKKYSYRHHLKDADRLSSLEADMICGN